MYIKQVKRQRSKDSGIYFQYMLAQTFREGQKVKQRNILYLGSNALLNEKENRDVVLEILKSKIFKQPELFPVNGACELKDLAATLFEKYCIKYGQDDIVAVSIPPPPKKSEFHNVDLKGMELEGVRSFGAEFLCKQVMDKLQLKEYFTSLGMSEEQSRKALIGITARAIFSESEHKTAQILGMNSELAACFGHYEPITHKQLYAVSDNLYKHKKGIDDFLYKRVTDMFDLDDKLVIFDISNSYFETRKSKSKLAKYGRSKEKRGDCPLVVFTGVINAQGFIRHSRIYEGNKADTATLADMVADLKEYSHPDADHTIVMDAGIATEDNLKLIEGKGYKYVCVSRKKIKDHPIDQSSTKVHQLTDRGKNKVELAVFNPEGYNDTWMYVQSEAKEKKEASMAEKLRQRFEKDIAIIRKALSSKGGTKKINKVWERIGRAKQKHNRVASQYTISVSEKDGMATDLTLTHKPQKSQSDKAKGIYFIRTNYVNPKEKQLWDIYNTIREVESTFRCLKSELNIRPVHHQNDERIEAHIYLTILAYQLVNTIRHMLKAQNIRHDWSNIVRIMSTQTIQNIIIPTDKKVIHLRKPSSPIKEVQQIYAATSANQTHPAVKKYVVYH